MLYLGRRSERLARQDRAPSAPVRAPLGEETYAGRVRVIALTAVLFLIAVSAGYGSSGGAVGVRGSTTPASGSGGIVASISCAAPGECAAGGYAASHYHRRGEIYDASVVIETNGRWGKAIEVPGTATLNTAFDAGVDSISCAAAGDCAAGGAYFDSQSHRQAFVVSETNGRWGKAIEVPGTATLNSGGFAEVYSISCAAAGYCAAGGHYNDRLSQGHAFVVTETDGRWGEAIEVAGTATLNTDGGAAVDSISCAAPGECSAGGYYLDGNFHFQAFVVDETNGSWGTAVEVPGTATLNAGGDADLFSVSCPAAGECAAGGTYTDGHSHPQAFTVSETNGSWGTAVEVPGTATLNSGGSAWVDSVSCAAAGECAAGGRYNPRAGPGHFQAFVVSETNGSWSPAVEVPGTATLNSGGDAEVFSVSCAAAGECAAGGTYESRSGSQAFVVSKTNGSWGTAVEVPGTATLNTGGRAEVDSVSCAAAGDCAAGGYVTNRSGRRQAFVVSETNGNWGTATQMHLPAACVVPKVVGKALRAAKKRVNHAGCGLGKITHAYSNLEKGRVIAQRPPPGNIRSAGTRVALTVSKG